LTTLRSGSTSSAPSITTDSLGCSARVASGMFRPAVAPTNSEGPRRIRVWGLRRRAQVFEPPTRGLSDGDPGRERCTSKSHVSLWEHSSHFRLVGRGVPGVSVVSQRVYIFLCLASPREIPQVPIRGRSGSTSCALPIATASIGCPAGVANEAFRPALGSQ